MAPFYGWGSTASRLEPLRGGSLLFTMWWHVMFFDKIYGLPLLLFLLFTLKKAFWRCFSGLVVMTTTMVIHKLSKNIACHPWFLKTFLKQSSILRPKDTIVLGHFSNNFLFLIRVLKGLFCQWMWLRHLPKICDALILINIKMLKCSCMHIQMFCVGSFAMWWFCTLEKGCYFSTPLMGGFRDSLLL